MVIRAIHGIAAAVLLVAWTWSLAAHGGEIRFYNVNKKGQQSEVRFVMGRDKPGCHNIFGGRDVFRVAQIGFTYCTVYAEKDCAEDSAMVMNWKGKVRKNSARAQPTERLMPGDMWYFDDNGMREVSSWKCVP